MDLHASASTRGKLFCLVVVVSLLSQPVYIHGLGNERILFWIFEILITDSVTLHHRGCKSSNRELAKTTTNGEKEVGEMFKICFFTSGGGGGGGGGYTVWADILSSADWYHHSIIYIIHIGDLLIIVLLSNSHIFNSKSHQKAYSRGPLDRITSHEINWTTHPSHI